MILRVDTTLPLPVYEQIREQVVRMVFAGTLAPGTRMPSIRQLASDLKLAKGTVAKAYALLEESAYLETRGHRGSFILPLPLSKEAIDPTAANRLSTAADTYIFEAKQLGYDLDSAIAELPSRWRLF